MDKTLAGKPGFGCYRVKVMLVPVGYTFFKIIVDASWSYATTNTVSQQIISSAVFPVFPIIIFFPIFTRKVKLGYRLVNMVVLYKVKGSNTLIPLSVAY